MRSMPDALSSARRFVVSAVIVCLASACFSLGAFASQGRDAEIRRAVAHFFYCFQQRKYEAAYDCFSSELKSSVPYFKFAMKARDIRRAWIKKVTIYDGSGRLGKLRIDVKLELVHKKTLYRALYSGTCDIVREKRGWKVTSVDLKAREAVPVEKEQINFN